MIIQRAAARPSSSLLVGTNAWESRKAKAKLLPAVASVAAGLLVASSSLTASAQTLYWDTNGATAGAGTGGTAAGTWDSGITSDWTTDSTGASATTTWSDGNLAVFSAGSDATGTYNVTLANSVNANGLQVNNGTIFMLGPGGVTVTNNTVTVANGAQVIFGADNQNTLTASGGLIFNGTGTGTLNVTNLSSNLGPTLTVNGGTVQVGQASTAAAVAGTTIMPNSVTVAAGATVNFRDSTLSTVFTNPGGIFNSNIPYSGTITGAGNVGFINPTFSLVGYQISSDLQYTGTTTVTRASLNMIGSGRLSGTSEISVGPAAVLALDNITSGTQTDRINDSAKVDLNGSVMFLNNDNSNNATETIGELHLGTGGQNYMTLEGPTNAGFAFGTMLTASTLSRDLGASMLVRGNVVGTTTATNVNGTNLKLLDNGASLLVGAGPSGTNQAKVFPGIYVESQVAGNSNIAGNSPSAGLLGSTNLATLATYDTTTNSIRSLNPNEYSTVLNSGVNFAPGAATTVSASTSVNAIEFGGAGNAAAAAGQTITVNNGVTFGIDSGTILFNGTGTSVITAAANGSSTLSAGTGGNASMFIHNAQTISLAGSLSIQAQSLTKTGVGNLFINSPATWTGGPTFINQGIVIVNGNNQLGTAVTLGNNGLSLNSSGTITFGPQLELSGSLDYNIPLTIGGADDTAAITSGTLNTFGGNSIWRGPITLAGYGANQNDRLLNSIVTNTGASLTLSGVISTAGGAQSVTAGPVYGSGIIFAGQSTGTIWLTGNSPNTFTGIARQQGGVLVLAKDGALGTVDPFDIGEGFIQNGGTTNSLIFANGVNYQTQEYILLNASNDVRFQQSGSAGQGSVGTGLGASSPFGVLGAINSGNVFNGHIAFGPAGSNSVSEGPSGDNEVNIVSGASLELSNTFYASQGAGASVDKLGSGELIISGNNTYASAPSISGLVNTFGANSYIRVTGGDIRLRSSDPNAGNIPTQIQNLVAGTGGMIVWDDSLAINSNRTNGVEFDLNGGEFQYNGNAAGSTAVPSGTVQLGNQSTVSVVAPGANNAILDLSGMTRSSNFNGTLIARGADYNTPAKIKLNAGALVGGGGAIGSTNASIIPWAVGDTNIAGSGNDFVTLDGNGYVHPLGPTEYGNGGSGFSANATDNVNIAAAGSTPNAGTTQNAIKLSGAGSISINGGDTLTVTSGAILNASGNATSISGGTLALGGEGVFTTPSNLTVSSAITGGNGLTKTGSATLALTANNSGLNGQVTIANGTLAAQSDAALGTGNVVLAGGNLSYTGNGSFTSSRNYTINSFGTNFWLGTNGTIDFGNSTATLNGSIQSNGLFNLNVGNTFGGGLVTVTNAITQSGQGPFTINVNNGALSMPGGASLTAPSYLTVNISNGGVGTFGGDITGQNAVVMTVSGNGGAVFNGAVSDNLARTGFVVTNVTSPAVVTFNGQITLTGSFTKGASGTTILNNTNTYTGATTINAGTLIFRDTAGLGNTTSNLTIGNTGVAMLNPTVDQVVLDKQVADNNGGNIDFNIPATFTAYYVNNANDNHIIGGTAAGLSGSGSLTKDGGGTLKLGNQGSQNLYLAGTKILGGVLEYDANDLGVISNGLASNTFVAGGGYWNIQNGATLRFNQGTGGGTSNVSNSTFSGSNRSMLVGTGGGTVEITSGTVAQANFGGISGSTTFTKTGPGEWWLRANDSGTIAAGTGNFTGKWVVSQGVLDITNDNQLGVVPGSAVANSITIADQAIFRSAANVSVAANRGITLSGGTGNIDLANNSTMTLNGVITGAAALNAGLSTPAMAASGPSISGTLVLAGNNTYTGDTTIQSGVTLQIGSGGTSGSISSANINNGGTLRFNRTNSLTESANISGAGSVVHAGTGTTLLNGNNTYAGTTTVSGGTLQVVPSAVPSGNAVTVSAGEYQMSAAGNYALSSLNVTGGEAHLLAGRDKSLTMAAVPVIGASGQLDLEDSAMIVNYAAGDTTHSVRDQIRNLLVNGRNGAAGQPGAWNGLGGITSSYAHNNGNGFNLAIGYGDNEDIALVRGSGSYTSFGGQTVASNTVLIQMTRGADATLDGVVDAQDVTILGSHFNKPNSGQWVFGDFDYSGTCDATDVTTLGSTFGKTTPTLSPAQMTAEFGSAFTQAFEGGASGGAVPEPASLTLLGLGGVALIGRRRRKAKA